MEISISMPGRSAAVQRREPGIVPGRPSGRLARPTAQAGVSGSMTPMQPRSSPRSSSVTNAAARRSGSGSRWSSASRPRPPEGPGRDRDGHPGEREQPFLLRRRRCPRSRGAGRAPASGVPSGRDVPVPTRSDMASTSSDERIIVPAVVHPQCATATIPDRPALWRRVARAQDCARSRRCRCSPAPRSNPSSRSSRRRTRTDPSAAASAHTAAWSGPAATESAASARTVAGSCGARPTARSPRPASTRSRRSRCSTWTRARSPTPSPRRAARSTARSARTGRSRRDRAWASTSRCARCRPRRSWPRPGGRARARSPTRTSSRRSSSSTPSTPGASPARPGSGTCSSPTATRRPEAVRPPGRCPRRGERGPQELRRRVLPAAVRRPPRARAGGDRRPARRGRLAGAHDPGHPGPQRRRRRAPGARALDRRDAGARRRRGT